MLLYLTRHGETEWNVARKMQGSKNSELTENGRQQAKELSSMLENERIDLIACSTLKRAVDTANIIKGDRNIPIIYDERLKEVCFGIFEGMLMEDVNVQYADVIEKVRTYPFDLPYPEGESISQIIARSSQCIKYLYEKYKGKSVLVVTHGALLQCLLLSLRNGEVKEWKRTVIGNCEVFIFEINGEGVVERQLGFVEE